MDSYQITLTLEIAAVNARQAKRLGQLVGADIARGQRRAHTEGAAGVTHAWIDREPRGAVIDWCPHSGVPVRQCVGCRQEEFSELLAAEVAEMAAAPYSDAA